MEKNEISYCADLVRKYDADKFLLSMFANASDREGLMALFAFNYEIAKIPEMVSEPALGLIRLQWWRDEVAAIYAGQGGTNHEVLIPLSRAIERYNLPRKYFDKLIHAREFDVNGGTIADVKGLINYADFTTTPLLMLADIIVGGKSHPDSVRSIAVNFALAGVLRSQGRELFGGDVPLSDIVAKTQDFDKVSNALIKGFAVLGHIYIKQIKSLEGDLKSPKLRCEPAFKALRLFWGIKML